MIRTLASFSLRLRPNLLAFAVACCLSVSAFAGEDISGSSNATEAAEAADEVYLQVTVNEQLRASLHRFVLRDGRLYASPSTLEELGLRVAASDKNERLVPVEREGVQAHYDVAAQSLTLVAPISELAIGTTHLHSMPDAPEPTPAPWGGLLNYDVDGFKTGSATQVVIAPTVRLFGPGNVVFESSGIVQATNADHRSQTRAIRLDSRIRWTRPDKAIEVIVGDLVTGGPDWARQTRMGGVRIGTNYESLQPYRLLSPGPVFSGESAVPSNVELYVNGIKQFEGDTPAGRFVVSGLPSMEGLGNARLVVTDAYGRARTVEIPFYGTRRLLARGLDNWSVAVGRVRLGYGATSNRYDGTVALDASWRGGLTDSFTGEVHAEARRDLQLGGLGAAMVAGNAGVIHVAMSGSRSRGLQGSQTRWGYQWANTRFSLAFDSQRTHGDYRDIAAVSSGFLSADKSDSASAGFNNARVGSFNLTYANLRYPDENGNRILGAYWNRTIGNRWFLSAGMQRDLENPRLESYQLSLSATLGQDLQAFSSMRHSKTNDSFEANLMKQARANGDFGWRVQARKDTLGGIQGLVEGQWLTKAAEVTAAATSGARDQGSQYRLAARGSVLWMGRSFFASREVVDGFALVQTGLPGVPVKLENRAYGVTNAAGELIVTPVIPFQHNRVSIDPTNLPANVRVQSSDRDAVPGASGATRVTFNLSPVHAAVVVLSDKDGAAIPVGSTVRRLNADGSQSETIMGYDSEVYLEGLSEHNKLIVETPTGVCHSEFNYDSKAQGIPRIESVRCVMEAE